MNNLVFSTPASGQQVWNLLVIKMYAYHHKVLKYTDYSILLLKPTHNFLHFPHILRFILDIYVLGIVGINISSFLYLS